MQGFNQQGPTNTDKHTHTHTCIYIYICVGLDWIGFLINYSTSFTWNMVMSGHLPLHLLWCNVIYVMTFAQVAQSRIRGLIHQAHVLPLSDCYGLRSRLSYIMLYVFFVESASFMQDYANYPTWGHWCGQPACKSSPINYHVSPRFPKSQSLG